MMKLWMLTSDTYGYDTYDRVVVAAQTEDRAKNIHPYDEMFAQDNWEKMRGMWGPKESVKAKYIGAAKRGTKEGVILGSFNAG